MMTSKPTTRTTTATQHDARILLEDLGMSRSLHPSQLKPTCLMRRKHTNYCLVVFYSICREQQEGICALLAHHHMTSGIKGQIDALLKGFTCDTAGSDLVLQRARARAIDRGMSEIDIDDMEKHTM